MTAGGGGAVSGAGVAVAAKTRGEGVGVAGGGVGEAAGEGVEAPCRDSAEAAGTAGPGYRPTAPSGEAALPAANDAVTSPETTQTSVTPSATSPAFAFSRVFTIPQQLQHRALRRCISNKRFDE